VCRSVNRAVVYTGTAGVGLWPGRQGGSHRYCWNCASPLNFHYMEVLNFGNGVTIFTCYTHSCCHSSGHPPRLHHFHNCTHRHG